MNVLGRLASAMGRNDERPNVELAGELAASGDTAAIAALVDALGGPRAAAHDAIKVLYEIGARRPELIAPYFDAFLALLASRSNRLQWGAMTALSAIAATVPDRLLPHLETILDAADAGSVITRDHANDILCALVAGQPGLLDTAIARLADAAPNQFVTYAEEIGAVVDASHRPALLAVLERRRPAVAGAAKLKRLDRLVHQLRG